MMGKYESGDYVKVEFSLEETGKSEKMWCTSRVQTMTKVSSLVASIMSR